MYQHASEKEYQSSKYPVIIYLIHQTVPDSNVILFSGFDRSESRNHYSTTMCQQAPLGCEAAAIKNGLAPCVREAETALWWLCSAFRGQ